MESNTTEVIQLVKYDLTFNNKEGEKVLNKEEIKQLNKNYNSIAIIGCQSSGKSTLLNKLFNTQFLEMNEQEGNKQTTQGIWLSVNPKYKTIVIDCEGTDSKERGEDRHHFEHCSSLFALALGDILIMNMWTQDVGRYTASNYGVLKMVFQMNLKLFQQECAKKVLIVLRDYDEKRYKKEKFSKQIMDDIYVIWNDIKKPEHYTNSTPESFFEFEFITLPHKIYREDDFDKEVSTIRERFLPDNSNYLFSHTVQGKNIPIDGYMHYCMQVWDTIINEKDLNIPGQKEMLAIYRCGEIKQESFDKIKPKLNQLKEDTKKKRLDDFKKRVLDIYDSCLLDYDKSGCNYLDKIYMEVRESLNNNLINELFVTYSNQLNRIIPIAIKFFSKELEEELNNNRDFYSVVDKIKESHLSSLKNSITEIRVFDSWSLSTAEYEENFDNTVEVLKKSYLERLEKDALEKLRIQIKDLLSEKIQSIQDDFWLEFNKQYINFSIMYLLPLKVSLIDHYRLDDNEANKIIENLEDELYNVTLKGTEKKTKEISSLAIEHFKSNFWYDEGLPRKWPRIDEIEIDKLFKSNKKNSEKLLLIFSEFKLIKKPLKNFFNYKINITDEDLNDKTNDILLSIDKGDFKVLLSAADLNLIKKRFEEGIFSIYEDAKRKHESFLNTGMPWWGWLVIAYTGYDDVWRFITSSMFFPLVFLISIFLVLNYLGMTGPIQSIRYIIQDQATKFFLKKKFS